MHKFLLADNPMRPDSSGLWIIHLPDPVAIISAHSSMRDMVRKNKEGEISKRYHFINSDGVIEQWTLAIYHLFTTDFLEEPAKRAIPLLDRAWRWYRSYLEWEDKQLNNDSIK